MTHLAFLTKVILVTALLFLCGAAASTGNGAYAQGVSLDRCGVEYEVVMKLRSPPFGSYTVWDGVYGEMVGDERIIGGALLSNGHLILAVQVPAANDSKALVMVEMDRRGRIQAQKLHTIKGLKELRYMIRVGDRFVVSADVSASNGRSQVWIGFFNAQGDLLRKRFIKDPKLSVSADGMVQGKREDTFHLSVAKTDLKKRESYSLLYHLDGKGSIIRTRSYRLGSASAITALSRTQSGDLIATGWVKNKDGRQDGWVLQLGDEMKLKWQQTFSRGSAAHFHDAALGLDGNVIAVGDVVSSDGNQRAALVVKVEARSGVVLWQRYYTDDHAVTARKIMPHRNRQSGSHYSVLMDSVEQETLDVDEFSRVVQVNDRGRILDVKSLFSGRGAHGLTMFEGYNQERVVVGYADVVKTDNENSEAGYEPVKKKSRDGIVLAVPAPIAYTDPCFIPEIVAADE